MILGSFDSASIVLKQLPVQCTEAVDFLRKNPFDLLNKKHILDSDKLFVMFSEYVTQPSAQKQFEQHKTYIDIHYVFEGSERIDLSFDNDDNVISTPYNAEKDVVFYSSVAQESRIDLYPGMFCICFPEDIHKPGVCIDKPQNVKKAVVKIHIDCMN